MPEGNNSTSIVTERPGNGVDFYWQTYGGTGGCNPEPVAGNGSTSLRLALGAPLARERPARNRLLAVAVQVTVTPCPALGAHSRPYYSSFNEAGFSAQGIVVDRRKTLSGRSSTPRRRRCRSSCRSRS